MKIEITEEDIKNGMPIKIGKSQAASNMKAQATSPDSPQALSSRRKAFRVGLAHKLYSRLRQIVAGSMCHVDCQIVAWAVVQGHRLRHKCELQKNAGCGVLSCSKKNFAVLYSGIVNLTNGGKYGITIRLHGSRLKGLDKRRAQPGSSFCLDDDVHRHERDHGKKQNRNFVPDRISPGAGNGSLDSQTIDPSGQKADQKIDWLQNQCWRKIYGEVYEPMVEILQRQDLGKNAQKIASSKLGLPSNPGQKWPGFFHAWKKVLVLIAHKHYHSHK